MASFAFAAASVSWVLLGCTSAPGGPGGGGGSTPGTGGGGAVSSGGDARGAPSGSGGSAGTNGTAAGGTGAGASAAGGKAVVPIGGGAGNGGRGGAGGSAGRAGAADGVAGGLGGSLPLVHPGALLTQADLTRVRTNVAAGTPPWAVAWSAIRTADAGITYQPTVAPTITDLYALQNQGHAAYVLAIKWVASGDISFATASIRILDAWVNTVTALTVTDATLRTGIGTIQLANAAEIIAHGFNGGAGWPAAQIAKAKTWFADVIWPRICAGNLQRSSNWGTSAMAGCMATAVFVDERAKLDYAVNAYKNGFTDGPDGCSGVTQYICNASGQATEAGRDQVHPQGGVAHLVEVAMMAWNQGIDLVSYADHRVVAGMEYLGKYNLGQDVPYDPNFPDPCNVHPSWSIISPTGRGTFSPVYEMANKLFTLANVAHPYTLAVLNSVAYQPEKTNSDHVGMGTLTAR